MWSNVVRWDDGRRPIPWRNFGICWAVSSGDTLLTQRSKYIIVKFLTKVVTLSSVNCASNESKGSLMPSFDFVRLLMWDNMSITYCEWKKVKNEYQLIQSKLSYHMHTFFLVCSWGLDSFNNTGGKNTPIVFSSWESVLHMASFSSTFSIKYIT